MGQESCASVAGYSGWVAAIIIIIIVIIIIMTHLPSSRRIVSLKNPPLLPLTKSNWGHQASTHANHDLMMMILKMIMMIFLMKLLVMLVMMKTIMVMKMLMMQVMMVNLMITEGSCIARPKQKASHPQKSLSTPRSLNATLKCFMIRK